MDTKTDKQKQLIKVLFKAVVRETVGPHASGSVKLRIDQFSDRGSSCGTKYNSGSGKDYQLITLRIQSLKIRARFGYSDCYYTTRPARLNKYILHNRHNVLRFVLYHEVRHAYQRINDICRDSIYQKEYDADSWALAHINTRPQDHKTARPKPKVAEYIDLYKSGISTTKIALLCKVKDPRSVRYYLTKAGISLRR